MPDREESSRGQAHTVGDRRTAGGECCSERNLAEEERKLELKRREILISQGRGRPASIVRRRKRLEQLLAELKQKMEQEAGHHIVSEARGQIRQARR